MVLPPVAQTAASIADALRVLLPQLLAGDGVVTGQMPSAPPDSCSALDTGLPAALDRLKHQPGPLQGQQQVRQQQRQPQQQPQWQWQPQQSLRQTQALRRPQQQQPPQQPRHRWRGLAKSPPIAAVGRKPTTQMRRALASGNGGSSAVGGARSTRLPEGILQRKPATR